MSSIVESRVVDQSLHVDVDADVDRGVRGRRARRVFNSNWASYESRFDLLYSERRFDLFADEKNSFHGKSDLSSFQVHVQLLVQLLVQL